MVERMDRRAARSL